MRNFIKILSRLGKWNFFIIITLSLTLSFTEMIGIGLLIPIFRIVLDPTAIDVASPIYKFLKPDVLPYVILGCAIFYTVKAFIVVKIIKYQQCSLFLIKAQISQLIFEDALGEWSKLTPPKASEKMRNITTEVSQLYANGLAPIITILNESLISIGVITILLLVNPHIVATISAIFICTGLLYNLVTSKKLKLLGKRRQELEGDRLTVGKFAFENLNLIEVFGATRFVSENFYSHSSELSTVEADQAVLNQAPKVWFELVSVVSLITFIYITHNVMTADEVLAILGIMGIALLRLLPSANKIISAVASLKYSSSAVAILQSLEGTGPAKSENLTTNAKEVPGFKHKICVLNLTVQNPVDQSAPALLDRISFEILANKFTCIVGESGSGKSTLVRALCGLIQNHDGSIHVDGIKLTVSNKHAWRQSIGYVPQITNLISGTIAENIAFGVPKSNIDYSRIEDAIIQAELRKVIDNLPHNLHTIVGDGGYQLSGGQIQRIGLARALYRPSKVLLLDEVTSALDKETESALMTTIHTLSQKVAVVMVTHRESISRTADQVIRLENGTIKLRHV